MRDVTGIVRNKINIKETFGFYKELKTGVQGKILMFPDIEEMHSNPKYVAKWVDLLCLSLCAC